MRRPIAILALSLTLAAPALAQIDADAQMQAMLAAQAEAQAAAARPGDEALACEALQAEMTVGLNDPAFQATMAASGAWAEAQMGRAEEARSQAMGSMAMGMGLGLASSFIPGLGMLSGMAMQAQAGRMGAQAQQNQAEMAQQAQSLQAHLPLIYRMERVYNLAQAKQCAFLEEGAPPP